MLMTCHEQRQDHFYKHFDYLSSQFFINPLLTRRYRIPPSPPPPFQTFLQYSETIKASKSKFCDFSLNLYGDIYKK